MQLPSSIAAFFITPQTSHDECERAYEAQAALVDEYRLTYAETPPVVLYDAELGFSMLPWTAGSVGEGRSSRCNRNR